MDLGKAWHPYRREDQRQIRIVQNGVVAGSHLAATHPEQHCSAEGAEDDLRESGEFENVEGVRVQTHECDGCEDLAELVVPVVVGGLTEVVAVAQAEAGSVAAVVEVEEPGQAEIGCPAGWSNLTRAPPLCDQ